ncbi:hypothetical protein OCH239_12675 [Roseivivax halodurans JCM 10272]|uniref:Uncharacterized protein n=1 Tax=Roseivivax halodurans JCM 10272 TaxID=1449350 RepID=X7EDE6_9RHOB|nr:tetratricopeptide repeat protein [Roseivivax halodurans]ETX13226.1 hypothetical protein OCH239_12675 [Roseivivax halodurans JCM 10272]
MHLVRSILLPLALVLALAACKSSEERAEEYFETGLELREAGDLERAALSFRNVFRFDGAHKEARTNLAEVLIEQGNPNAAFSQYLRLAEQYPNDVGIRIALSELAISQQAWSELERHGNVAIEAAPERPEVQAIAAMIDYVEASQNDSAGGRQDAVERARTLLETDPDLTSARQLVIFGSIEAGEFDAALDAINTALEAEPDDLTLNTLKLQVLNTLERPDEVEALLQDMYARFPENEEIRQNLIAWYLQREDLGAVETLLREIAGPRDAEGAVEDHITLVRFLAQAEGVEAARAELSELIEASEGNTEAVDRYVLLDAGFAFDSGEQTEAVDRLQARLDDDAETPVTNDIRTTLAQMHLVTGDEVTARALVEETLAADESNVAALKMRAEWQIEADDPNEAITSLRTALDQAPNDSEILTLMARAHLRAGSTQLAGERLALAVDLSENGPAETLRYARFLLDQNREAAARSLLAEAIDANPGNLDLLTEQARLALSQDDTATARTAIAALERIDSPEATDRATTLNAALLLGQQRFDESVALLEERAEGDDAPGAVVLDVVRIRLEAGQVAEARSYLSTRLEERPEDPTLRFAEAVLQMAAGETEEAENGLRELIEDFPEAQAPVRLLHGLLVSDDREEEARELLAAAVERMPEARELQLIRASNFEAEGDLESALDIYETLYEQESDDTVVANNYASLLSDLREDEESLARAADVARRLADADVPALQDTYGWIAYRQGNFEEALSYLEPAAEGLPDNPVVLYHLGMTYAALERSEEARETLQRAVDAAEGQSLPQIDQARETLEGL